MDSGWPVKAKKKSVEPPIVEPKPTGPFVSVEFPGQSRANPGPGIVAAHHTIVALLPPGLRGLLPAVAPDKPIVPSKCDYGVFIEWLRLPQFATGSPSPDWSRKFALSLGPSRLRVIDLLTTLVELGAEPQSRQFDLFYAWWELENMEPSNSTFQLAPDASDMQQLISTEEASQLASIDSVASCLHRLSRSTYTASASGWNQRSLLSLLGYAVGVSGGSIEERRTALRACFVMPDALVPRFQREFWGPCASRRRSRAIERMIRLFVSLAEHRTSGNWARACSDWSTDISWIGSGGLTVGVAATSGNA
jgi:hypothetical protein